MLYYLCPWKRSFNCGLLFGGRQLWAIWSNLKRSCKGDLGLGWWSESRCEKITSGTWTDAEWVTWLVNIKVRKYYELNNYTKLFIPNKNFLRISRKFKTCISTVLSLYHEMYPKRFLSPPQEKATSVHKNYSIYIKSCMMGDYMQKRTQKCC